jgi:hypothetical protein
MMDYALLFSIMGVMILFLAWKLFWMTDQRNYYRNVIARIGLGEVRVKITKHSYGNEVEIKEGNNVL